jgi:hypothetical protein
MMEYIGRIFQNQYASGIILLIVGAILGVIVSKIKSRISLVTYSVSTSKLGETANNTIHGKIEVRHRDQILPNFYFSRVRVQNISNSDLEGIRILFYVGDGVLILSDYIRYENEVRVIPYTAEYAAVIEKSDSPMFFARREYNVPVLNRGQAIVLELTLTHRAELGFPYLYASMVHKGAKLVEKPYTIEYHGVSVKRTFPWAIIIGVILYVIASAMSLNPWIGYATMLIYGLFAQSVSAFLIKSKDWVIKKIGI